jgi:hypothetical protein
MICLLKVIMKGRIIPRHHFCTAYGEYFKNKIDLSLDYKQLVEYLKGNVTESEKIDNGYGVITVNRCSLGEFNVVIIS